MVGKFWEDKMEYEHFKHLEQKNADKKRWQKTLTKNANKLKISTLTLIFRQDDLIYFRLKNYAISNHLDEQL